jgi:hypothetical protein
MKQNPIKFPLLLTSYIQHIADVRILVLSRDLNYIEQPPAPNPLPAQSHTLAKKLSKTDGSLIFVVFYLATFKKSGYPTNVN